MIPNCKQEKENNDINKNMYMITEQMMTISEDVLSDYPNEVAYLQKLANDVLNASDYNDYPIVFMTNVNTPSSPVAAIISKYVKRNRLLEISSILPAEAKIDLYQSAKTQNVYILGSTVEIRLDANDKVKSSLLKETNNLIGTVNLPFLSTEFNGNGDIETYTPTNDYQPATKKYVDDVVTESINNLQPPSKKLKCKNISTYTDVIVSDSECTINNIQRNKAVGIEFLESYNPRRNSYRIFCIKQFEQ